MNTRQAQLLVALCQQARSKQQQMPRACGGTPSPPPPRAAAAAARGGSSTSSSRPPPAARSPFENDTETRAHGVWRYRQKERQPAQARGMIDSDQDKEGGSQKSGFRGCEVQAGAGDRRSVYEIRDGRCVQRKRGEAEESPRRGGGEERRRRGEGKGSRARRNTRV